MVKRYLNDLIMQKAEEYMDAKLFEVVVWS